MTTQPLAIASRGGSGQPSNVPKLRNTALSARRLATSTSGNPLIGSTFHKIATLTDQLNHTTTYSYDASYGDLLTIKDALNGVTTLVWGVPWGLANTQLGLLFTATDALNHTTSYGYDSNPGNFRLMKLTDAGGYNTTFSYDDAGSLASTQSPFEGAGSSNTGTLVYDSMEQVTDRQDALNQHTTYAYDALGHVTTSTNGSGVQTTFTYCECGALEGITEAVGTADQRRLSFTDNAAHERVTMVDGNGNTTSYAYDAVGRLTKITDPLNGVTTYTYDVAGELTAQVDQLGHATSYGYDAMGRVTSVQDALNNRTTTTYDLAGNVLSVKNANNITTSFGYDALNRMTQQIDDKGGSLERTTTYGYDAVGNMTTLTDGLNHTTTFSFDELNREITRKDALGHVTTTAYYTDTQTITQTVDALGNTTTRTYDLIGQLSSVSRPGGGTANYYYDAAGNNTSILNELNKTTTYTFDNLNRVTKVTDPLNGKTTYVYDANDNRTLVVDPDGNRSTFVYDALNRLITQTDPLNHSATFAYDAAGRMTSTTDQLSQRRDFTYDAVNQKLTEKWYTTTALFDRTNTFSWDAVGNMLTAVNPDGACTYTYDNLDRISTAKEPFGLTLTYTYDAADNRTVLQDSKGGLETYSYDAGNRLTDVKFTGNSATLAYHFDFDARDSVTKLTRFNSITGTATVGWTSYTYDSRGRLTNLQDRDSSNTSLENTTFTYDNFDRLTTKKIDGTTTTYSYDDTNQLTGDGTNNYSYDANGNRTGGGYTTGTGNQTTNDGTWTYTYDTNGNRTKKSKGSALETWNYGYDEKGELIWVEKHATDGGTLQLRVAYKYDALGNRIERTEDSNGDGNVDITERYGYDGANVWADLDGTNALTNRRLFGIGVDTPIVRVSAAGVEAWYLRDYQNSVTQLVDSTGATLGKITYDGFGNIVTDTTGANGDRFKFTSREWDSVVKLQYNRARYYDPSLGKWISTDPMGFDAGDANLYRYVGNGPTDSTDPGGLIAVKNPGPVGSIGIVTGGPKKPWWRVCLNIGDADSRISGAQLLLGIRQEQLEIVEKEIEELKNELKKLVGVYDIWLNGYNAERAKPQPNAMLLRKIESVLRNYLIQIGATSAAISALESVRDQLEAGIRELEIEITTQRWRVRLLCACNGWK